MKAILIAGIASFGLAVATPVFAQVGESGHAAALSVQQAANGEGGPEAGYRTAADHEGGPEASYRTVADHEGGPEASLNKAA